MSAEVGYWIELGRKRYQEGHAQLNRREAVIDFAYYNLVLNGCNVTREQVKEAYDKQG